MENQEPRKKSYGHPEWQMENPNIAFINKKSDFLEAVRGQLTSGHSLEQLLHVVYREAGAFDLTVTESYPPNDPNDARVHRITLVDTVTGYHEDSDYRLPFCGPDDGCLSHDGISWEISFQEIHRHRSFDVFCGVTTDKLAY